MLPAPPPPPPHHPISLPCLLLEKGEGGVMQFINKLISRKKEQIAPSLGGVLVKLFAIAGLLFLLVFSFSFLAFSSWSLKAGWVC